MNLPNLYINYFIYIFVLKFTIMSDTKIKKAKYCETLEPGFYLVPSRCLYVTGTTKGNKWIPLDVPEPEWNTLMWNCIEKYVIDRAVRYDENPTEFKFV